MQERGQRIVIGGSVDSLCLSYYLQKKNLSVHLLTTKKRCNYVNTYYNNSNVIENGCYYSFILRNNSTFLSSLLKHLNLETEIIYSSTYSNNILYLDENGQTYRINKFLFRLIYHTIKDYFFNKSVVVEKNVRLDRFISNFFDEKICKNLISPYCRHYFGFSPRHVFMRSYFSNFLEKIKEKKSIVKAIISPDKNNALPYTKKRKIFTFRGGNILLTRKLREYLDLSGNVQLTEETKNLRLTCSKGRVKVLIGRDVVKFGEVVFCGNPLELKRILKKAKFDNTNKDIIIKYLFNFCSKKIKITNVCFKKNVLPLSHSLESLLLVKENHKNKIMSMLYDSNIFPHFKRNEQVKNISQEDIFETKFLSSATDEQESEREINSFLRNVLNIKEKPDLVVSNCYTVFPHNDNFDQRVKKLIQKKCKNLKIFWTFSFFKDLEFCLSEAEKFCEKYDGTAHLEMSQRHAFTRKCICA
ncbi:conserved Plasmodium protein, unknown function [Plasmodium malariae]|uniref:Amine oxidase domain-containing protein n=1 Tax=Plasmodium malariae TaxID=5858 RepID=A0A1C3KA37_PLAMA|nr:conserved Plasmodium protein, unknown function [Plasmodium malariae]